MSARRRGAGLLAVALTTVLTVASVPVTSAAGTGPRARTETPARAETEAQARRGCTMYPIAHRGEHRRHDENTLGSIRAVRRAEVDLRVTRDGRFVLMHDRVLDRTTNGTGRVLDRSWRYVRSLRTQPRGARVPTWAQVLDAARASGTRPVVEVKSYNADWRRPQLKDATRQVRRARMGDRVHFGGQVTMRRTTSSPGNPESR